MSPTKAVMPVAIRASCAGLMQRTVTHLGTPFRPPCRFRIEKLGRLRKVCGRCRIVTLDRWEAAGWGALTGRDKSTNTTGAEKVDLQAFAIAAGFGDQILEAIYAMFGSYGTTAVAIAKIIGINIILSGDNAVVIALACRSLPPRQRMIGILLGAGAAIVLRIIFTVLVNQLLGIHYLKLIGGLLLFWIAVKLVTQEEASEESVRSGGNVWEAVKIVAIADIVMSLDNVLAIAAAAGGDMNLIIFGLVISIPLVIGGATLITNLLTRYPILVWAGAALLGWVAGELLATEPALAPAVESAANMLGVSTGFIARIFEVIGALIVVGIGKLLVRRSGKHTGEHATRVHADER